MKKLLLTLCLLLLLVPAALAAEEIAPTVLGDGEYAVTGQGKELTAWYNEVGTLKVLNHSGDAVDAGSPDTVFECLGPSDRLSGSGMHFAMGAVYGHSKSRDGTVIFGGELEEDTLTVSGVLNPYTPDRWAVTDLVDGTWTVKGGLTGAVAYTEVGTLNMKGSASVRLEGWVENTAPTGYAVKLKYYGKEIALGGGASLSGGQAEIWMANGASVSATAGGTPYTGDTVRLALAADFGEGVAVTNVEAESTTCFSCIDPSYMLVYDSAAKTLTAKKRYYTVTYDLNDSRAPSNLQPPKDTSEYATDGSQSTTALPPSALVYENKGRYEFLGWNTRADGGGTAYAPGASVPVTGDMTLYARWKKCTAALLTPEGEITYYETPDMALAAAPAVATIRLLTRTEFGVFIVAEGKTITLDLNGYTAWDSSVDGMFVVEPGGSLTILGQGGGQLNGPYMKDIPYLWNKGGTLILDGGEYSGHKTVLLHEGGATVLKQGVLLRGSTPSTHIKVVGANAAETLRGMLDAGCRFSPGLITANEDNTEAVLVGGGGDKATRVLAPEVATYKPILGEAAHGTVTVKPARPGYGQTVTLSLTSDEGYEPDTLTVTYGKTKTVELTKKEDGTYTFRQPASAVTVTAVFRVIPPPFTDVGPADAYYEAVAFVGRAGLMNGVGEGLFAPKSTMTRAEAWTVLYRMSSSDILSSPVILSAAKDLKDSSAAPQNDNAPWYSPAQAWAMAQGVSDGNAPDAALTHWQFTTMLRRMGLDVSPGDDTPITRADAAMLLWQTGKIG